MKLHEYVGLPFITDPAFTRIFPHSEFINIQSSHPYVGVGVLVRVAVGVGVGKF